MADASVRALILAGGSGTRLWPRSTDLRPKPFLALAGGESLLRETYRRTAAVAGPAKVYVSGRASHAALLRAELPEVPEPRFILEPVRRNTAPAIALSALVACADDANAVLLVLPSDQAVSDEPAFLAALRAGAAVAAKEDAFVTLGIPPTRPETGYGYMEAVETHEGKNEGVLAVRRFVEKPDAARAAEFLASGRFLWNAGIFLFKASLLLEELQRTAPEVLSAARRAFAARASGDHTTFKESFSSSPSVSIDVAVMEKAKRVLTIPCACGWSDLGSWEAIFEFRGGRPGADVIEGDGASRGRLGEPRPRPRAARARRGSLGRRGRRVAGRAPRHEARRVGRPEAGRREGAEVNAPAAPAVLASIARLVATVRTAYRGPAAAVEDAVVCLLARGHLLIEDVPGVGKTTLATALGKALGVGVHRLQFTPDTLPSDILGLTVFNQRTQEFEFHPGPIFTPVLLADEINRATPKTQSALLQAMNERAVSSDGVTRPLPEPFLVLATQNPVEYLGTYPLPESQLDRFLLRISLGYPAPDEERRLLIAGGADRVLAQLQPALSLDDLKAAQEATERVTVADKLMDYILAIVARTRAGKDLLLGVSPRGAQGFFRAVQARALVAGRPYATPDDVKRVAGPALAHRVLASQPGAWDGGGGRRERDAIQRILDEIPVPL